MAPKLKVQTFFFEVIFFEFFRASLEKFGQKSLAQKFACFYTYAPNACDLLQAVVLKSCDATY